MNVTIYATDLPIRAPADLQNAQSDSQIILNQHIYLSIDFGYERPQNQSITVTIQSRMQTSPPYILDQEFEHNGAFVYHLEFQQHEPLPDQDFIGELDIVHFSNGVIQEKQVPIRVTNPINLEITGIFHVLKQPAFEFKLFPKKTIKIVSLIFQCKGVAQEMLELQQQEAFESYEYKYFMQLTNEFFEQIKSHPDALNVTVMYQFKGQINTIYFNFDCQARLNAYLHSIQRNRPLQLLARLIYHVPQSHCDLEKNEAYYAVSLDVLNISQQELRDVVLSVYDVEQQVIALTRKIEINKLEVKQSQTIYLEFYSYQRARLIPEIIVSVGQARWSFQRALLIE